MPPAVDGMVLEHVQVVTRHGARTPLNILKLPNQEGQWLCDTTDALSPRMRATPDEHYRYYQIGLESGDGAFSLNCRPGDLMVEGMRQHFELGQAIRKHYVDDMKFMSGEFDDQQYLFMSSFIDRSIRSAESLIEGLFPAASDNEVLTISTASQKRNVYEVSEGFCEDLNGVYNKFRQDDMYLNLTDEYWDVIGEALTSIGYSDSPEDIVNGCSDLLPLSCGLQSPPSFVTKEAVDICYEVQRRRNYKVFTLDKGIPVSYFIKVIFKELNDVVSSRTTTKFALFSAHDTTIAAMMAFLTEDEIPYNPPYASHLVIELWNKDGEKFLRFSYNGEPVTVSEFGTELVKLEQFSHHVQETTDYCHEMVFE